MIAGALATLVVAGALVMPAVPAAATPTAPTATGAGVPPSALGDCNASLRATGGWGIRDVLSEGTAVDDPSPVRPRSARLFEPCFDTTGFNDAPLGIAALLTDIPVPMLDEDEDGEDDGPPAETGGGPCTESYTFGAPTGTQLNNLVELCGGSVPVPWTGGDDIWQTSGDIARVTFGEVSGQVVPWSIDSSTISTSTITKGFVGYITCKNTITNLPSNQSIAWFQQVWSTSLPPMTGTVSCASLGGSYVPYKGFIIARTGTDGDRVGGMFWKEGEVAQGFVPGCGYYGGTQCANYTFGAGTDFGGVTDNGSVVCSPNYDGSNPVVHPINNTELGSWSNIDRSPEPPILDNPESPEWSAKVMYYPTDTLTGGVYRSNCDFLVSITLWVCAYTGHGLTEYGCIQMVWSAERFRANQPYFGTDAEDPEVLLCTMFPNTPGCYEVLNPDALEAPIVCEINAEGEFFEWLIQWVSFVPDWIACMVTPEGWDRSDKLSRTWELGAPGQMQQAFYDSMPSGIGCGQIGQIPYQGQVLYVDTCEADFAPDWVKVALAWLLVLGLAALALKRIMWSVGGNK